MTPVGEVTTTAPLTIIVGRLDRPAVRRPVEKGCAREATGRRRAPSVRAVPLGATT